MFGIDPHRSIAQGNPKDSALGLTAVQIVGRCIAQNFAAMRVSLNWQLAGKNC